MSGKNVYTVPKVWTFGESSEGAFANVNRPTAGARKEQILPVGEHPFQLYSFGTPNGVKVTVMFEELLAMGISEAEYDAWLIEFKEGDQFGSGFVEVNPNSKIPALLDASQNPAVRIFESGAILQYLAEKFGVFMPKKLTAKAECLSWLFWNIGSAPFVGGGFGHFYKYAPEKQEYPINRYTLEVKRQLDVLDRHLAMRQFLCGDEYTIADIANHSWYGVLITGEAYDAQEFLSTASYKNVVRWVDEINERQAVRRGQCVNRTWGPEDRQLRERHSDSDFDALGLGR